MSREMSDEGARALYEHFRGIIDEVVTRNGRDFDREAEPQAAAAPPRSQPEKTAPPPVRCYEDSAPFFAAPHGVSSGPA